MVLKSTKSVKRLLISAFLISAFFTFSFWKSGSETETKSITVDPWVKKHWTHVKILSDTANHLQNHKIIMLWTKFFGITDYVPKYSSLGCSTNHCIVTSNRDYLNRSDAILFHLRDINLKDMPSFRTKNQAWVLLHHESPPHTPDILKNLDGLFNWTATYRYDSEIILSPLVKKQTTIISNHVNHFRNKRRMVAWLVSNCNTPGKREEFVKELQNVIPVDIYGTCGKFTCLPKMSDDCYEKLGKIYKFYLSFENSICKDYATEKLFRILSTDMVPVVFGGANYSKVAPPFSYIDALSFKSPKELGHYLLHVAKDEKKYNSYFEWKKSYRLDYNGHYVCHICKLLNQPKIKHSIYHNISNWWFKDANCRSWSPEMNAS